MLVSVLLVVLVYPLVEIYAAVRVAHVIGAGWTLLLLAASTFAGAWSLRHQGGRWRAVWDASSTGRAPTDEVIEAVGSALSGLLLFVPGLVSGVAGVLLAVGWIRRTLGRVLAGRVWARAGLVTVGGVGGLWSRTRPVTPGPDLAPRDDVIDIPAADVW